MLQTTTTTMRIIHALLLLMTIGVILTNGQKPVSQYGPYKTSKKELFLPTVLNYRFPWAVITYPKRTLFNNNNTEKYPLIVFAHGFQGGGLLTYQIYKGMLKGLASFGFIVIAPRSCNSGCPRYGQWDTYDNEILNLLKYIDTKVDDTTRSIFHLVNRTAGYGVVGHSTGGRATAEVLAIANTTNNIKAGVLLHAYPSVNKIFVPTAVYTGVDDTICCGEEAAKVYYENVQQQSTTNNSNNNNVNNKAYANMIDATHTEPNFKTRWTIYTAAWFKIYLNNDNDKDNKYYNLIYNNTNRMSLCGGAIPMKADCETL